MSGIGLLILAAGASTRLGQPKQLLVYRGQPLIRWMAGVAIESGCQPIGVVLGASASSIKPNLTDLDIHIVENEQWSMGMASSIQVGLQHVQTIAPELDAIVLMLCDQPLVSAQLIHQLIAVYRARNAWIVASEYAGILGAPALFHHTLFPELAALQGDVGARHIIHQYRTRTDSVPFAEGVMDIDTPQDYERLSISR